MENIIDAILNKYDKYYQKTLNTERIRYKDIEPLLNQMQKDNLFRLDLIGKSIDGRNIYAIYFGNGKQRILAWSQMHGDEPTATAVLFDIINFFSNSEEFDPFRKSLLNEITFCFIPMLNPDGAEKYQRENSINIDLNRDALAKQSPESKVLWEIANNFKPDFGFNLHDQNSYYTAGRKNKHAALSFLAPPFDFSKTINPAREKSMQLIVEIKNSMNQLVPENIARYNDDYEIRAFGDNFSKSGISTILIESGYYKDDVKKDFVRKLNFIALLYSFQSIASNCYLKNNPQDYYQIPENETLLFDLLLRDLIFKKNSNSYKLDIGINREKKWDQSKNRFYYKSKIAAVGDLSTFYGIEEYDFHEHVLEPIKLSELRYNSFNEIVSFNDLLNKGIGIIRVNNFVPNSDFTELPINILPSYKSYEPTIAIDDLANLLIIKDDQIKNIVINGFMISRDSETNSILNGIVIT
jgi:hypothetical protein